MPERIRRAGSKWRLLVHEMLPGGYCGSAHHVGSDRRVGGCGGQDTESSRHVELPGTEFDELVVGSWLHVEQMDSGKWWMNIGGVVVWVRADRDGRPVRVDVYGPGEYDEPVPGVEYGGPALADVWPPSRSAVGGEPEATSKSATECDDNQGGHKPQSVATDGPETRTGR